MYDISIILVETESPGNIGSVARAMKTTGFSKLVLVNPCETNTADVRMMAHRSREIVKNAKHYGSLKEALSNIDVAIGTTMRKRHIKFPIFTPEQISEKINLLHEKTRIALVFGRETNGLNNDELNLCQMQSTIPIATKNPALNLSQAVMIYSYILFRNLTKGTKEYKYEAASHEAVESIYTHMEEALNKVQFKPRDDMKTFISRFRRFVGRTIPEHRDVQMLHKIIQVLSREKYRK